MTVTDDGLLAEPTDPSREPSVETRWTRVCSLDQLIPERGIAALVGPEPVALFLLDDGTVHAVGHRDPFSDANVMARGIIGSVGAGESYRDTVASPMYKQVFDLATGECLSEPGTRLPVHPVRIVEGHVEVGLLGSGGGP
jgi:nitrite reductase (NADH) small subunit